MKDYSEMFRKNKMIFAIIRWLKFILTFVLIFFFVFYGMHAATRMMSLHDTAGLIYSSLLFLGGVIFLIMLRYFSNSLKMKQILSYLGGETVSRVERHEEKFVPPFPDNVRAYNPFILWKKGLTGYNVQLERYFCKSSGAVISEKVIFRITKGCPRYFKLFADFRNLPENDLIICGQKFHLECKAYDGMLEQFFTSQPEWMEKMVKILTETDPDGILMGTDKSLLLALDYEVFLAYGFSARRIRDIFDLLKNIADDISKIPQVERRYEEGTGVLSLDPGNN